MRKVIAKKIEWDTMTNCSSVNTLIQYRIAEDLGKTYVITHPFYKEVPDRETAVRLCQEHYDREINREVNDSTFINMMSNITCLLLCVAIMVLCIGYAQFMNPIWKQNIAVNRSNIESNEKTQAFIIGLSKVISETVWCEK